MTDKESKKEENLISVNQNGPTVFEKKKKKKEKKEDEGKDQASSVSLPRSVLYIRDARIFTNHGGIAFEPFISLHALRILTRRCGCSFFFLL